MKELKLHNMKSHDCYVFMQKLIPIAFREMLPESVWSALTEVSLLFQIICSTILDVVKVQELEDKVATILCILEKIFPPSFFNSMEQLIVYMPYEARVGGPVQYRWMYPLERLSRNDDLAMNDTRIQQSIFNFPGQAEVTTFPCYFVNDYNFHTERHSVSKSTFNCGVCVKSSSYTNTDSDFYEILEEVIQLDYPIIPTYRSFCLDVVGYIPCVYEGASSLSPNRCELQEGIPKVRTIHPDTTSSTSVLHRVPSMKRDKVDWMAVCKIKARRVVDDSCWTEVAFQEDESIPTPQVLTHDHNYALHDPNGIQLVVDLNQQGAGTSRAANGESNDEPNEALMMITRLN
ncbi:UNVERIFIED_CONTAM: hypothetical protein Sangu_0513100 [Sesamum angustifolium]|uniref:DUF4218 domain-containing protein n=1 Tax=Sesamum angustifolium TaxID=2727405 RepID=A0AAW2Q927_9LAMI